MNIKAGNKEIKIIVTTKKVVELTDDTGEDNLEELFINAINKRKLKALCLIVEKFAEKIDGTKAFKNLDEVYVFIDDYKSENKSTDDLFMNIAKVVNEEGFFKKKMTDEELEETMKNPFAGMNLSNIVEQSVKEATNQMIGKEMNEGFLG